MGLPLRVKGEAGHGDEGIASWEDTCEPNSRTRLPLSGNATWQASLLSC